MKNCKPQHPLGNKPPKHPLGHKAPTHPLDHGNSTPAKPIKAPPQLPSALAPAPMPGQNPGVYNA